MLNKTISMVGYGGGGDGVNGVTAGANASIKLGGTKPGGPGVEGR